jgi:hypothetical protein
MTRTEVRQERRMAKFLDMLDRWNWRERSMAEAGGVLGISERQVRRCRDRLEEEGPEGLVDRRPGRASARRVPLAGEARLPALYRARCEGWTVPHVNGHLRKTTDLRFGYTWLKLRLQGAGLVSRTRKRGAHRRKRERKPCVGMMLHQDASRFAWLADQEPPDLVVTLDDATCEIYAAFPVDEEGRFPVLQGLLGTFPVRGLPASLCTDRGRPGFHTPEAGGKVDKDRPAQVGRALAQFGVDPRRLFARGPGPLGTGLRPPAGPPDRGTGPCRDQRDRGGQPLDRRDLPAAPQRPLPHPASAGRERLRPHRSRDPARRPLRRRAPCCRAQQHGALRKTRLAASAKPPEAA